MVPFRRDNVYVVVAVVFVVAYGFAVLLRCRYSAAVPAKNNIKATRSRGVVPSFDHLSCHQSRAKVEPFGPCVRLLQRAQKPRSHLLGSVFACCSEYKSQGRTFWALNRTRRAEGKGRRRHTPVP